MAESSVVRLSPAHSDVTEPAHPPTPTPSHVFRTSEPLDARLQRLQLQKGCGLDSVPHSAEPKELRSGDLLGEGGKGDVKSSQCDYAHSSPRQRGQPLVLDDSGGDEK